MVELLKIVRKIAFTDTNLKLGLMLRDAIIKKVSVMVSLLTHSTLVYIYYIVTS